MLSQVKDSRFKNSKSPISIKDNIIIQSPIIVKEFIKKQVKDGENSKKDVLLISELLKYKNNLLESKKFPRDNVGNKDRLVVIKPSESQINSQSIYNSIADKLNKMSSITSIKSSERKAININAMLSSQQESLTQLGGSFKIDPSSQQFRLNYNFLNESPSFKDPTFARSISKQKIQFPFDKNKSSHRAKTPTRNHHTYLDVLNNKHSLQTTSRIKQGQGLNLSAKDYNIHQFMTKIQQKQMSPSIRSRSPLYSSIRSKAAEEDDISENNMKILDPYCPNQDLDLKVTLR